MRQSAKCLQIFKKAYYLRWPERFYFPLSVCCLVRSEWCWCSVNETAFHDVAFMTAKSRGVKPPRLWHVTTQLCVCLTLCPVTKSPVTSELPDAVRWCCVLSLKVRGRRCWCKWRYSISEVWFSKGLSKTDKCHHPVTCRSNTRLSECIYYSNIFRTAVLHLPRVFSSCRGSSLHSGSALFPPCVTVRSTFSGFVFSVPLFPLAFPLLPLKQLQGIPAQLSSAPPPNTCSCSASDHLEDHLSSVTVCVFEL